MFVSPLAVFQINCLRRICGISLRDHVPNVNVLNRCNTLSVESQLQGKRHRWLGHVFRMPNDRLPKKLLFGQIKELRPPGRPKSSFNDVALHDCQTCRINRSCRIALERQDLSRTYLAHHELESVIIIIIVSVFVYRTAAKRLRLTVSGSAACPLPVMSKWEKLSGNCRVCGHLLFCPCSNVSLMTCIAADCTVMKHR